MLSRRQRKAVRLMFQKSDDEASVDVGVRSDTLALWQRLPEFREALSAEQRAVKSAAARITLDASLIAAKNLHKAMSEGKDAKLALDTLKASGAFDQQEESDTESLAAIMRRVVEGDGSDV